MGILGIIFCVIIGLILVFSLSLLFIVLYSKHECQKEIRKKFKFETSKLDVSEMNYQSDLLNYKWFTGNNHIMYKICQDSLLDNEVIVVSGECKDGVKFMHLGVFLVKNNVGNNIIRPVSNSIKLFEDGKFTAIIPGSAVCGDIIAKHIKYDDIDHVKKRLSTIFYKDLLFYIDLYGGRIDNLEVNKYKFNQTGGLLFFPSFPSPEYRTHIMENDMINKDAIIDGIKTNLIKNAKKINNVIDFRPLNIPECEDKLKSNGWEGFLPLSDLDDCEDLHRDVCRFISEPLDREGLVAIYFLNHDTYGKGKYNRISLVNKSGAELKYFEPKNGNKICDGLHSVICKLPDEPVQVIESIFCENTVDSIAPLTSTVFRAIIFNVEDISQKIDCSDEC